jgi:hypothetical protein
MRLCEANQNGEFESFLKVQLILPLVMVSY